MKIIYEQGDIVYTSNNQVLAIVLRENTFDDCPYILELREGEEVQANNAPKCALTYKGHINLSKLLRKAAKDVANKD